MKVSYLGNIKSQKTEDKEISEIIEVIKSERYKAIVELIRSENNKEFRNILKSSLPQLFPTVCKLVKNRLAEDSEPTGIIQFDIDLKGNEGIDMDSEISKIINIQECYYAFKSPSGGIKFGIKTDFIKGGDETIEITKQRFSQAYHHVQEYIREDINVTPDNAASHLKQACYISHDPDAYLNEDCKTLEINDRCKYQPDSPRHNHGHSNPRNDIRENNAHPITEDFVLTLLKFIPKDLHYNERMPVNFAVLISLGERGIDILLDHWSKEEKSILRNQLEDQIKNCKFYNINTLIKIAEENGYQPVTGSSRRKLSATLSNFQFDQLLTIEEAESKLEDTIRSFFKKETPRSVFLRVASGIGKTHAVLSILKETLPKRRILFLVPNHELADEIMGKLKKSPNDFKSMKKRRSNMFYACHIKGKTHTCLMPEVLKEYEDSGINMPLAQCLNDCPMRTDCDYILQFSGPENIRVMTHQEYTNRQSAWFNGTNNTGGPSEAVWEPEFIIIDEDWMTPVEHKETLNTNYDGIRNIINDIKNGLSLQDAIENHREDVISDYGRMIKSKRQKIPFTTRKDYIREMKIKNQTPHSKILEILYNHIKNNTNSIPLKKIRFIESGNALVYSEISPVASRYENIPTLYLDATANEYVVKAVLGDVEYISINARRRDDINIYQLENQNWTKSRLEDQKRRDELLEDLRLIVKRYGSVGLITYKNIPGIKDFDRWLADQLGVKIYGHFGKLRGLNKFDDLDCILIVGRHCLPESEVQNYAHAIVDSPSFKKEFMDRPLRMKNGEPMSLNNFSFIDARVDSINKHFSCSETMQAIGRGRYYHGKPKDIYIYSNESLGGEIEITDFFRYEPTKYSDQIEALMQVGFCQNKPSELKKLGFSEHSIKKNRGAIDREIRDSGIDLIKVKYTDRHYKKREKEYYVSDPDILEQSLLDIGATKFDVVIVPA
ncbi:BT4734/BF3469 family protein [Imhoffiella purpurea]|nr:BT4734/BF3469 family protein [Imhoffiella purpurea]